LLLSAEFLSIAAALPGRPKGRIGAMVQDKEFMATLAKGLTVLGTFDKERPTMTLSQAALATGLSRATARRILRTLTAFSSLVLPISQLRTGSRKRRR
jgi:response regulator of citrate/malate metabolism